MDLSGHELPQIIHEFHDENILDVDVDFVNNRLYWLQFVRDTYKYSIMSSNFSGAMKRTILEDEVTAPKTIALDPLKGFVSMSFLIFVSVKRMFVCSDICFTWNGQRTRRSQEPLSTEEI